MQDVFISYSRRNLDFARSLEKRLREFKPPRDLDVPQRYLNVFRDEADITGTDYYQSIERHLGESGKLIVVCSPEARASTYVNDEIRRFAGKRGAEHIVPILLDGVPNNAAAPGQEAELAFPDALCEAVRMPLAIPYLGFDAKKDRVDKSPFADAWFSLLANIYGVSRADVERREKRRQARNRRITVGIVSGVIAALAIALVVSLLFWGQAVEQQKTAERATEQERIARGKEREATEKERVARLAEAEQRKLADERRVEAERQRAIAEQEAIAARSQMAHRVAVQALEKLAGAPQTAVRLGLAAIDAFHTHQDPPVVSALGALQKIDLAFAASRPLLPPGEPEREIAVDPSLEWAAVVDTRGRVLFGRSGSSGPRPLALPHNALNRGERWGEPEPELVFTDKRLLAVVPVLAAGKTDVDRRLIVSWPLPSAGAASVVATVPGELSGVTLKASPDGRWLFWTDRWRHGFLRRIDASGAPLAISCGGYPAACIGSAFSPDSEMFFVHTQDGVRRFALADAATEQQPPWPTDVGEVAEFETVLRTDARESGKKSVRLAILGKNAAVEWFDTAEAAGERHALPSIFKPFEPGLVMHSVDSEYVRASLEWRYAGEGLLVNVASYGGDFGIAAFHDLEGDRGWQPIPHRYELEVMERTSRANGIVGGPIGGYAVEDAANLGVSSALWITPFAVGTVGFDGTLLVRAVDEEDGTVGRMFRMLATDAESASFSGQWIVVGKRDGKLDLIDFHDEGAVVMTLNGHAAPVRAIRAVGDFQTGIGRMLSTDAAGVSRIWDLTSPIARLALNRNLYSSEVFVTPGWDWLVDNRRAFWPLRTADPLWEPVEPPDFMKARFVAWNEDRSRAATLHPEAAAIVVRLWSLTGDPPRKPLVERRFPMANLGTGSDWQLRLATAGGEARLLVSRIDSGNEGIWTADFLAPRPVLRKLAGEWRFVAASADLHWVAAVKTGTWTLLHLPSWTQPPRTIPIALPEVGSVGPWSRDGRWVEVRGAKGRSVLDLHAAAASGRGDRFASVKASYPPVQFAAQRPPMVLVEGAVHAWQESPRPRFVPLAKQPVLRELAWDETGRWLAVAREARVSLAEIPPGEAAGAAVERALRVPPLPPSAVPEARGPITGLFPFPTLGWVVAETDDDYVLLWHRRPDGTWEEPLTFTLTELRIDHLHTVRFRPDGRMALLEDQILSFDPAHLMNYSRRLVGEGH